MTRKYEWYEKRLMEDGSVDVLGYYEYEQSSVLAGQIGKVFIETFDFNADGQSAEAAAEAKYGSMNWFNQYTSPQVSLSHLPGEDDPVPGGMYPDDIGGGYEDW